MHAHARSCGWRSYWKHRVVASDIFGVSDRSTLAALVALVAGERDPKVMANLTQRTMRANIRL